jgi:toxin-antitoxin system PIN domain toxin
MMVRLLDVNVLIALMWPAHEAHAAVQEWFSKSGVRSWATSPFTQAGFVRIVSNPAFSTDAVTPGEALSLLTSNLQMKGHRFWPDEIAYDEAIATFRNQVVGHRQVTDAYLLGLAIRKGGRLATLDNAVATLVEPEVSERYVEIIGS